MINQKIIEWARERDLFSQTTPSIQFSKTLEEITKLQNGINYEDKQTVKNAIGGVYVTLVLQAELQGLNIDDCIASAYHEIKNRTGEMVGGKFVKDGE